MQQRCARSGVARAATAAAVAAAPLAPSSGTRLTHRVAPIPAQTWAGLSHMKVAFFIAYVWTLVMYLYATALARRR